MISAMNLDKRGLLLWIGCAPNSTETQKESKWPKSDSKLTPADRPQSDLKLTQKWLRALFLVMFESLLSGRTTFESLLSHFWSLLGHLNSFGVSVESGARPLLKATAAHKI